MRSHDLRHVRVASTVISQIAGLLGRRGRDDLFLLIPHCRAIHTWFMRSAIDVVFLDGQRTILAIVENGEPWRIFRGPPSGTMVLELPPGHARELGLSAGDQVVLREK